MLKLGRFAETRFPDPVLRGGGAFLVPGGLRGFGVPELHLHPHYREQTPLDAALAQVEPGRDEFVTERYHDEVASILERWRAGLLQSPQNTQPIENAFSAAFWDVLARG